MKPTITTLAVLLAAGVVLHLWMTRPQDRLALFREGQTP